MTSYDVKFWDTRKIGDTARGRWRVRWAVAGREHCKSFAAKPLADGFLTTLKDATRDGTPFDDGHRPARPAQAARGREVTWYDHARAYTEMKWPDLAAELPPVGRRGPHHHHPGPDPPRAAAPPTLASCARPCSATRSTPPPATPARPRRHHRAPWTGSRTRPCRWPRWKTRTPSAPSWTPAPGSWTASPPPRPPAAASGPCSHNALGYAVERRPAARQPPRPDPVESRRRRRDRRPPRRRQPRPGRALLAGRPRPGHRAGEHLEAFFGCLYYAALRPAEAVALREADCVLPAAGWGRIDLAASAARAGPGWTDDGAAARNAASSTAPPARPAASPSRPSWSTCSAPTSARYGTSPGRAAVPHRPRRPAATTPATAKSGSAPAPPRSPPPSTPPRWPAAPTTCATPPSPCGSTPASPPPRSPAAPATASPSCSRSTPTASTARPHRQQAHRRRPRRNARLFAGTMMTGYTGRPAAA